VTLFDERLSDGFRSANKSVDWFLLPRLLLLPASRVKV
jgi:hypothetical protein